MFIKKLNLKNKLQIKKLLIRNKCSKTLKPNHRLFYYQKLN